MNETTVYFLVSFIVDIFAILLAVIFFISAKRAETQSAIMQTEIKAQVANLKTISNRWLDKYTTYFTEQQPNNLSTHLSTIVEIISIAPKLFQPNNNNNDVNNLKTTIIALNIVCLNYMAKTNYFAQGYLPSKDIFDITNYDHNFYKNITDVSYNDFYIIKGVLDNESNVQNNQFFNVYNETLQYWLPFLRNSQQVFEVRNS